MQLKKGQIVELEITKIAFGGAGIGKYEGLTVFVEGVMVGDKVRASFTRIKPKFAEAELVEVVKESKDRVKVKCPHFFKCGGCQLQFMPYKMQLEMKKQHVVDSFERIGKIFDAEIFDVIGCEEEFYYRNKMEFSFGYDANMNFTLGMHVPGRRFDIMDIDQCYLESEFSVAILNKVREVTLGLGWKSFKYSAGEGFLRALYIREGKRTGEVMVNLVCSDDEPEDLKSGLEKLVEELRGLEGGNVTSIYYSKVISRRGIRRQVVESVIYGKKSLSERLILENGDELVFEISPQAFFQVNTFQAEKLYSKVLEFAGDKDYRVALDLFCGTGTIGLFLAKHCEQVYGIELNESAVEAARGNAKLNGIFNVDFLVGDVGKVLKSVRERSDLVVVDPPRAGLTEKIIKSVNEFGASRIIYVSCNPSTLARDCAWFGEYGYKVKKVQSVDMFPHTSHIECVCLLER